MYGQVRTGVKTGGMRGQPTQAAIAAIVRRRASRLQPSLSTTGLGWLCT